MEDDCWSGFSGSIATENIAMETLKLQQLPKQTKQHFEQKHQISTRVISSSFSNIPGLQ